MTDELQGVRERYARRATKVVASRYSPLAPPTWLAMRERQSALLRLFSYHGLEELQSLRVVEIGAGSGGNLLELLRFGFAPENLTAIELLPERAATARRYLPTAVRVIEGDAAAASIGRESQDIVYQSVVFSSLLDATFQDRLAAAMWSWLRPGGGILWYDFTFNNPSNSDVRGVPRARVKELFPDGRMFARRVTLAPPVARLVCRAHPSLYTLLNALPLLRTHLLCWIQKP